MVNKLIMKAYYKLGSNQILLDFEKPIFQSGIAKFTINNSNNFIATTGPTTDSLFISCPVFTSDLDDIWLSYTKNSLAPNLLYTAGNNPIVDSFSILVLVSTLGTQGTTSVLNTTLAPLISDFIDAYGLLETITITNPENSAATSPDEYKLIRALEDGEALYNSYITGDAAASKVSITAGKRRTVLTFARYFLDSRCRRKNVTEDYEKAVLALEVASASIIIPPNSDLYNGEELAYSSQSCLEFKSCGC